MKKNLFLLRGYWNDFLFEAVFWRELLAAVSITEDLGKLYHINEENDETSISIEIECQVKANGACGTETSIGNGRMCVAIADEAHIGHHKLKKYINYFS